MSVIIALLMGIIAISLINLFSYYCAIRGLLYYLAIKHNDMLDENKIEELTKMAIKKP